MKPENILRLREIGSLLLAVDERINAIVKDHDETTDARLERVWVDLEDMKSMIKKVLDEHIDELKGPK